MKVAEKTKEKGAKEREALHKSIAKLEKAKTERERVEKELARAEQEKMAILDSMSELVIIQDAEHRMIWVNKAAGESVNLSPKQLVGKYCYKVWPKRDKPCVGCPVAKARKTGKPQEGEMATPDGKVWFIRGYPIKDANGDVAALVEMVLDITDHKQWEVALQGEKNKLQSVIDAMEYSLTIQDRDFNIIYQNKPSRIASGGDHVGEKCYRAYARRKKVCEGCPVAMAFRDGKSHTAERKGVTPSGEVMFFENAASPIRDAKGNIISCLEVARDITDRKQAEEALHQSNRRFRDIAKNALEWIWEVDAEGKYTYSGPMVKKILGYKPGEVLKKHFYDLFHPDDREELKKAAFEVFAKKQSFRHFVNRNVHKDGQTVWLSTSGVPVLDDKGNLIGFRGVDVDVTELKQAEEALQAEKNKLQSVVGSLESGLTIQDRDYNIIYQNEPSKVVSGGDRLGEKCYRVYAFRDKVCPGCPVREAFKDGKSHTVERKRVTPSGEVAFFENTANPIRDAKGKIVSCLEVTRSITRRKLGEEALQLEKNKLQSVIDAMEDGLTIQDRDFNIIYQNELVRKLFGDCLGQKCYQVYERRDKICDDCPVIKAFRDGKSHTSEKKVTLPSGKVAIWEPTANPIRDAKGKIVSCLEIVRDITERKQAEQALVDEATRRRILIDQSLVGIVILDVDAKVYYANQRFAEMLGYTPEEVLELHTWDWDKNFPPEELLEMGRNVDEAGLRLETQHHRKDGSVIDVDISINGTMFEGQKLIFCVCRDISDRKRAEEALQLEKNKLQSVIDAMEEGLTIQDRDFNIIYQNELVRKLFGDCLGEKCYRVYEGRDKLCDGCPVKKAFKDGKSHTSERKVTLPSGERTFWENTANPIRDAKGKIVSCLEINRNITERKQAEQALVDEATRRRILIDQSLDGIVILDVDAKVYYANQRFAEMLGYTPEEVLELHTWDWDKNFPPEELLEMGRNVDETGLRLETQHHCKDGSVIDVDISINGTMFEGQKLVFCVCRDITDRKRAEEALQLEKNKLQSVIDALEYGLTIQDRDFNIIYQNEPARISSGGDRVGEKCYRVYEHREKLCDGCPAKKAFKDGKSHTAERSRISPSGELTFWENTASPIRDAKGKIVSCLELGRDITERKKVEQTLVDEATRRRILIEQSRDGIVVLDQDGKVYEANRRFAEMLGYTPEEAAELHVWDWEYLYPREQVLEMVRTVDEAGDHFETRHRRKDGSVYDVEISTNGAMFAGKKLIFCVCRDITERKQAEEKLKESEEKYKTLAEDAPMGIYFSDFTGKFLYGNKRAAEMVGYKRNDLIGKSFLKLKLFDSKGLAKAIKLLALNKMGRSTGPDEFVLHRKDGSKSTVEIRTRITKVSGRKMVLGMVEDITERKQMEEALRESEEKLRKMFESVTDGILVVDLEGVITGTNGAAARMHGLKSSAEMVGKNALELVVPSDHDRVTANMRKALKQGTVRDVEYILVKADGSEFPGELSTSVLKDAGGNSIGHITIARDITARKRGEQARKEAEDKYRNLVEGISDMIWETDEKGVFTFVSPKIKDTLGYDAEEVVGKRRTLDFAPKREAQKWLPRYKKINASRVPFSGVEITHIHKNGNPVVFEASGAPFFDSAGNFKGFVGINKDITERKQAEEEVKRQKAYFQQLFDNSPEGIALLDEADRFVQVNRSFEKLFGYQTEEIKGRFVNDILIPEDHSAEAANLSRAALNNQIQRLETARRRKDGSLVEVDVIGYPIIFDNQTVGVYVIYNDITERKQGERALRESQEFSTSLLESSPNSKFVVNPDTSVKYVNPAFEKLTGFTSEEIVGTEAPYPWWPEEGKREMAASFKNAMVTGGRRTERAMRKKNGERFWVAINSAPVVHEGRLLYFLVDWLDITERKQMEEERMELEQKAHLASRLASVGEMAAGIAHEINNPMTSVIGFSQLLMDSELPDDVKEDINVIHKEAQRAANVARNLLTFARKHAPTKQPTSINSVIDGVLKLRAYEQGVSNIRVNTRFAPDLPEVMADYSQMQQVFINIVLNAEGAMLDSGKGGTLTVTTQQADGFIRASFNDSGPGISRENLNRIFDPFFTTKEVGKGTGLGLSVCHGIVAEHGGKIYARSKPGSGATFVVELPVINNAKSSGERS